MSENKEIKLNKQAFDETASKLKEYVDLLKSAEEKIASINESMKNDWLGDGGNNFSIATKVLETKLLNRINDLNQEISDLNGTKYSMFAEDNFIAGELEKQ